LKLEHPPWPPDRSRPIDDLPCGPFRPPYDHHPSSAADPLATPSGQQGHGTRHIQETTMTTKTEQIRTLNDQLRQNFSEGTAVLTCGIAALGAEAVARIVKTIAIFDDFCHANDPHQEHDFGAFEADGHAIFFKIDYYDKALTGHSPDAADRSFTERVITVMRAEEY
jgi:Protein of unknown function (DUF3768)